ncbi:hypothetical protein CYY_009649 [Polysphondylium violaceum]|uniref:Uncharacterized protein n=1 Tax=Polysphondylium violaceum TaxID=133409 RepID=A0A8J4UVQ9_9MYCE|nr:hypothetical protein CYY_009649 [Polysphondylium violaceum]
MNTLSIFVILVFVIVVINGSNTNIVIEPSSVKSPLTSCIYSQQYSSIVCPDIFNSIQFYSKNNASTTSNSLTLLLLDGTFINKNNNAIMLPLNTNTFTMTAYSTIANVVFSGNEFGNIFLSQNSTNNSIAQISISNIQFQNITSTFSLFNFNTLQGGNVYPNITVNNCKFYNISGQGSSIFSLLNTIQTNDVSLVLGYVNVLNSTFTHIKNTAILNSVNYQVNINQVDVNRASIASNSLIGIKNANVSIVNSIFNNTETSARTLSLLGSNAFIQGSSFINNLNSGSISMLPSNTFQSPVLNITNCQFTGNQASDGGAVLAVGSKTTDINYPLVEINFSTFTENVANASITNGAGGALYFVNIDIIVQNTVFLENIATNDGASFYISQSTLALHNSTISQGHVLSETFGNGGGISSSDSRITITSSVLVNNSALSGNNIYCDGSTISVDDSNLQTNSNTDPNEMGLNCDSHCTLLDDVASVCSNKHPRSYWKYTIVVIVAVCAIAIFLYILYQKTKKPLPPIENDLTVHSPLIA